MLDPVDNLKSHYMTMHSIGSGQSAWCRLATYTVRESKLDITTKMLETKDGTESPRSLEADPGDLVEDPKLLGTISPCAPGPMGLQWTSRATEEVAGPSLLPKSIFDLWNEL